MSTSTERADVERVDTPAPLSVTAETRPARAGFAAAWGGHGWISDVGGPVHWVEFTPDPGAPVDARRPQATPMVLVHGLGGSHLNWALVGAALATGRRVIALDLPGFGLSHRFGRSSGVTANATLLGRFVTEVVGGPVVLVGNSMGGMIAIILSATRPDLVERLVLASPVLPQRRGDVDREVGAAFTGYAVPGVGEAILAVDRRRMSPRDQVDRTVRLCFAHPELMSPELREADVGLLAYRALAGTRNSADYLLAARSLLWLSTRPAAYRRLWRAVEAPTLVLHGEKDRLVGVAAARALAADRPDFDVRLMPEVGHIPMMEQPRRFEAAVTGWLPRTGS